MSDGPRLVLRSEWVAAGLTDELLDGCARRGGWSRVGRGAWLRATAAEATPTSSGASGGSSPHSSRVRPEVVAAALRHRRGVTLGPVDAAAAWGLPEPLGGRGPRLLAATEGQARASGRTGVIVRPELDQSVDLPLLGVSVPGPLTTVVDCALLLPGRDALAIADAALHRRLVRAEDLAAAADAVRGRRGAARARRVLTLADGLRESPLESWSCWAFDEAGVPAPRWQVPVLDEEEGRVYRLDCQWGDRLAGEADGRSKAVLRAAEAGGATADRLARVLEDERRREGRLRAMGFAFVRWSPRDVLDAARLCRLAALIDRHLAA